MRKSVKAMNDFYNIRPNNEPGRHFCGYGPVSVLVQVTDRQGDSFSGVAIPLCGSVPPFAFSSFPQLTALLDELCDELGRPVRSEALNSFSGNSTPLRWTPAQPVTARKLGHFTIEILYRQNQSLQGRIIVPDREETPAGRQSFRSDIELLHLMREYMS